MTRGRPHHPVALERCVGDADAFLRDAWSLHPSIHHAGPGAYDDLLSVADIDSLVATSGLRLPFARLVRDGVTIDTGEYTYRAGVGSRPVVDLLDPARVVDLFADGATLVLQGLHRNWAPLVAFCGELSVDLGHPTQANAYLSTRANRGFELHYDVHDVFVVQVTGSKAWEVFEPPHRWPVERWSSSEADRAAIEATPADTFRLGAGDCLYLPKGTPHRAIADDDVSLHITVGVPVLTRADVIQEALAEALASESLRAPLAPGATEDPERLAEEVRAALDAFTTAAEDASTDAIAERVYQRLRRARVSTPRTSLATTLRLDEIGPTTRLAATGASAGRLRVSDDVVELLLADRTLTFPEGVAPALELIMGKPQFSVDELPDLDADSQLVLARRLVREGAVGFVDVEAT
ncbi:MAG TPA: cupin domain-containing protein [Microthrixaceae bacterium]|nr:cupin domain-containing protein [Microthrixaceae bacterium]